MVPAHSSGTCPLKGCCSHEVRDDRQRPPPTTHSPGEKRPCNESNASKSRKYAFNHQDTPLLKVEPGETFEIETYDASTGYFRSEDDKAIPGRRPGFDRMPPMANPIGGPVWVAGAERGDVLVVTIEEIIVDDYSWIAVGPRRGPLGESTRWPELSADYTTKIFRHTPGPSGTTRDGTPALQRANHLADHAVRRHLRRRPRPRGDDQRRRPGRMGRQPRHSRCLPPAIASCCRSFITAALFYLGDVHASQGDTEFTGTAAETKSTVRLKLDVIKAKRFPGCASRSRTRSIGARFSSARGRRRDCDVAPDGLARSRTTASRRRTRIAWSAPARISASTSIRCARSAS